MNTTYKQQIEAIQFAMSLVTPSMGIHHLALNDAGSTIASLNLSDPYKEIERLKDLIISYEMGISQLNGKLKEANDIIAHYADVNQNQ